MWLTKGNSIVYKLNSKEIIWIEPYIETQSRTVWYILVKDKIDAPPFSFYEDDLELSKLTALTQAKLIGWNIENVV